MIRTPSDIIDHIRSCILLFTWNNWLAIVSEHHATGNIWSILFHESLKFSLNAYTWMWYFNSWSHVTVSKRYFKCPWVLNLSSSLTSSLTGYITKALLWLWIQSWTHFQRKNRVSVCFLYAQYSADVKIKSLYADKYDKKIVFLF